MVTKGENPRDDASSEIAGSRSGSGHEVGRFPGSPAGVEEGSPKRCVSDGSLDVDLERGLSEIDEKRKKGKPSKAAERDCRICHLGLESASPESGLAIELGCSCKGDLGAAHRQCAETWFKIRGNKTCEICGTIARNVVGSGETEFIEQWNESNNATATPASTTEARPFWLDLENFGVFPSFNNHHHWLEKAAIENQAPQSTAEASFSLIVLTEREREKMRQKKHDEAGDEHEKWN